MDTNAVKKCNSFSVKRDEDDNSEIQHVTNEASVVDIQESAVDGEEAEVYKDSRGSEPSLSQIIDEIDQSLDKLSVSDDKSSLHKFLSCVDSLLNRSEKLTSNYESNGKFDVNEEDDSFLLESSLIISKMMKSVSDLGPDSELDPCFNRASNVLHTTMVLLEAEFRSILESCGHGRNGDVKTSKSLEKSVSCLNADSDTEKETIIHGEEFQEYSSQAICSMNRIAATMIECGYQSECVMVYNMVRRNVLHGELEKLSYENISVDETQKMQWKQLQQFITTWISVVDRCSSVLLPREQKLCAEVFVEHPSVSQALFPNLALSLILRFLTFVEAVAITKRSAEKLFKILDMFETLRKLYTSLDDENLSMIKSEITATKSRLGEASVSMFCDLENSIRGDNTRTPVPGGAVHPLTRYTINYLTYACTYKNTLEEVFEKHRETEETRTEEHDTDTCPGQQKGGDPMTPFSNQVNIVMTLLDDNLQASSDLYSDIALRSIFKMNNGRYILRKVKESKEMNDILGAKWLRKKSSDLREYHRLYKDATLPKLMACLKLDSPKVTKPMLKDKFREFNAKFEELHRTQSAWVVSDEQLQSELTVSLSTVVTQAYRSFFARYHQYFTPGRQAQKYLKYQPEEIEKLFENFFSGNPSSMAKKRI